MTGPATFLAVCEKYRIAEEALPGVRQEFFRLNVHSAFVVSCQEGSLKITFKEDAVLVAPAELLALLAKTSPKVTDDLLWQQIKATAMNDLGPGYPRLYLMVVIVVVSFLLTLGLIGTIAF